VLQAAHTAAEPSEGKRSPAAEPLPGAVNVWDRFGGARSSGRDDPTQ